MSLSRPQVPLWSISRLVAPPSRIPPRDRGDRPRKYHASFKVLAICEVEMHGGSRMVASIHSNTHPLAPTSPKRLPGSCFAVAGLSTRGRTLYWSPFVDVFFDLFKKSPVRTLLPLSQPIKDGDKARMGILPKAASCHRSRTLPRRKLRLVERNPKLPRFMAKRTQKKFSSALAGFLITLRQCSASSVRRQFHRASKTERIGLCLLVNACNPWG